MFQTAQQFAQFIQRSFIFFRKFKEHTRVGNLGLKLFLSLEYSLQSAALLQQLLGGLLV